MVESTALEMRRTGNRTVGSNPTLSATQSKAETKNRRLSSCLHQRLEGDRSRDQGRNLPDVQLAVKAKAKHTAVLPSDDRGTAKRSAIQDHLRPGRKSCRAIQLRAAARQVEKMDGMTLSVRLEESRHCHWDARISAAVFVRSRVLRVRSGGRCHLSPVANAKPKGAARE